MAKNKERNIYNIDKVNLDIDYAKLAEAIVEAEHKAKDKKNASRSFRIKAMGFVNGMIYSAIYCVAAAGIYVVWSDYYPLDKIPLYGCILFSALLLFLGIYAFLCQQESFGDNSTGSMEHFNTNVAMIALIVALIALIKG